MNIKLLREKANMTQESLAIALNIGRTSIAMWEKGSANPKADKLPQIAKILNCTIDDLF